MKSDFRAEDNLKSLPKMAEELGRAAAGRLEGDSDRDTWEFFSVPSWTEMQKRPRELVGEPIWLG